jgi:hypothetical protein
MNGEITKERAVIEEMTDEQVIAKFGTWEDFLKGKESSPSAQQDFIDAVQEAAQKVAMFVKKGFTFEEAVAVVKTHPGAWIGVLPWVEAKRQAREMLVG